MAQRRSVGGLRWKHLSNWNRSLPLRAFFEHDAKGDLGAPIKQKEQDLAFAPLTSKEIKAKLRELIAVLKEHKKQSATGCTHTSRFGSPSRCHRLGTREKQFPRTWLPPSDGGLTVSGAFVTLATDKAPKLFLLRYLGTFTPQIMVRFVEPLIAKRIGSPPMRKFYFAWVVVVVFVALAICAESNLGRGEDTHTERNESTKWKTWKLPSSAQLGRLNLTISPHQRWICFFRKTLEGEKAGPVLGVEKYVMLDTKTGAETRVKDFFKEGRISGLVSSTGELQFSPSGKYVVVHAGEPIVRSLFGKFCSLFVVNLKSEEVTKLASNTLVLGRWIGESVIIGSRDMKTFKPLKIADFANDKTRELRACGLILACDPMGRFMIILGDPKSLGAPAPIKESPANHLLAVNLQSKIIRDFGLVEAIPEEILISRDGKYLIYKAEIDPFGKGQIRVVSLDDGHDRTAESAAIPIAVSDDGTAVLAEGGFKRAAAAFAKGEADPDSTYAITIWDVAGDVTKVLEQNSIIDVVAVGDRLYYVTVTKQGEARVAFVSLDALLNTGRNPRE